MYSWKTVRNACILLLLLPPLHMALLLLRDTLGILDSTPERWSRELDRYEELDRRSHLPSDPLLLVGGRRATMWRDLEGMLSPMPVLNRGLARATIDDIQARYERLVGFYQPRALVVVAGISEFHLRDNKSAGEFVSAVQALAALDLNHRPGGRLYLVAPVKAPQYPEDDGRIDTIVRELTHWAAGLDRVVLLDPNPLLTDAEGGADPRYFRPDGINLNEHGYLRLSVLLRMRLEQDYPEVFRL